MFAVLSIDSEIADVVDTVDGCEDKVSVSFLQKFVAHTEVMGVAADEVSSVSLVEILEQELLVLNVCGLHLDYDKAMPTTLVSTMNVRHLTHLDVPYGTEYIGDFAFLGFDNLQTVTLPDTLLGISANAFSECTNLKEIIIPDSVTTIGVDAFKKCTKLSYIKLPDSLQYVPCGLCRLCNSLKTVEIPDNVVSISAFAFNSCASLQSVILPKNLLYIMQGAFSVCTSLEYIRGGGDLHSGLSALTKLEDLHTHDILWRRLQGHACNIEDKAFSWCSNLKEFDWLQTKGLYCHTDAFDTDSVFGKYNGVVI